MSCGLLGPSMSGSPARTRSLSWTFTCTPRGSEYSLGSPPSSINARGTPPPLARAAGARHDDDLALSLHDAAVLHEPVDLRDDRGLARLARLEELDDARQTARDVLGLRGFARDLGEHLAGRDRIAVFDHQVGMRRHVVLARQLARLVADLDRRLLLLVGAVHDDLPREAGDLV